MIQVTNVDFKEEGAVIAQMILSPNAIIVVVINTYVSFSITMLATIDGLLNTLERWWIR